jgi:hypothetical protein
VLTARALIGTAAACAVLALVAASAGSPRLDRRSVPDLRTVAPRHPTVVLVVFDELPLTSLMDERGRIDRRRYPSFASLAGGATWYRGATGVHDSTTLAVPAILDGRYPRSVLPHDYTGHPDNLFTLFGGRYRLDVSEDATLLCPPRLCPAQARAAARTIGNRTFHNLGSKRPARFRAYVRSIRPRPGPTLYFKHTLLPHVPWEFLPSGHQYRRHVSEVIPGLNSDLGFNDPFLVRQSYQRHLLQTGLADRLLGELLRRLRRTGLYEQSLIVVTADHGIGFHRGANRRAVTLANIQDLAPVPLIVKAPLQRRGRIDDRHVETVDVVPTIARFAHLRPRWRMDGMPVGRRPTGRHARVTVYHRIGTALGTVGGRYVVDAGWLARRRARALARKLRLFGSGDRGPGLFAIGPHRELVGKPLSAFRLLRPGRVRVHLFLRRDLRAVRPASGYVPCHVQGRVVGRPPGRGHPVAVAVNGRIVGTGVTVQLAETPAEWASVLVPESALRAGANRVEVLAIGRRSGRTALRPLGSS